MLKLLIAATLIGRLTVTSYRPVKSQTDDSPYNTSTGEHVRTGGCAVSRDLLCDVCMKMHRRCPFTQYKSKLHYGDWIYVERYGFRQANDIMGAYTTQRINGRKVRLPIRRHIDIFVWTHEQEAAVDVQKLSVFRVDAETAASPDPERYRVHNDGTFRGGRR